MNRTVFSQSLRQVRKPLVAVSLGAAAFFYLVLLSSSSFATDVQFSQFLRQPPRAVQALMGGSLNLLQPAGWVATGMTHPITLSLFSSSAFMIAAGAVAAEVERGSIDLVLTRPVGRIPFLAAKGAAAVVAVTIVEGTGLASALVARLTIDEVANVSVAEFARAFLGSSLLFTSFALIALFVSARSSLRGRAIGLSVGVVVLSFFVNFTALLIDELYALRFASLFHYFRPAEVMAGSALGELWVLVAVAAGAGAAALYFFSARDIKS